MTRKIISKKSRIQKLKQKKRKNTTRKKKGGSDTEDITDMVDESPHPAYDNVEAFERDRKELYYFNLLLLVDSIIPNTILNADFGIRPFDNDIQMEIYEEIKEFTPEALDDHINEIHTLLRSNNPLLPELPEGYVDLPWKEKFLWIKAEREKIGAYTEQQQTGGVIGKKKKKIRKTKRRKKKKNTTRKKKRGAGPACSRPQVNEDNQSDYSDGSNPDYPIIAEQMPDNEPLPPGAQRIPTVPYPSASAERVPEIPIASTEISLDTDNTPDLKAYNPALYNTKLSKSRAHNFYNIIYNTGRIEEDTEEIENEVVDALMNYVYHVNYFDPFSAQNHGNPNKIGDSRELYDQVYNLIGAWNIHDGEIENLLWALRSDPDEEIGF